MIRRLREPHSHTAQTCQFLIYEVSHSSDRDNLNKVVQIQNTAFLGVGYTRSCLAVSYRRRNSHAGCFATQMAYIRFQTPHPPPQTLPRPFKTHADPPNPSNNETYPPPLPAKQSEYGHHVGKSRTISEDIRYLRALAQWEGQSSNINSRRRIIHNHSNDTSSSEGHTTAQQQQHRHQLPQQQSTRNPQRQQLRANTERASTNNPTEPLTII